MPIHCQQNQLSLAHSFALCESQIRKLRDPQRDMRYKALLAAEDLLSVPLGLVQCISAGITEALTELLQVLAKSQ
jgi:hypothetical protein